MTSILQGAVVLRVRGKGKNILTLSRGMSSSEVQKSSKEVVQILGNWAAVQGRGDFDATGDLAPTFSSDLLLVNDHQHQALYKLLNSIFVIVLAPIHLETFVVAQLVDAISHILTALCKGADVTADKLLRRYGETCLAISYLIDSSRIDPRAALAQAHAACATLLVAPGKSKRKQLVGDDASSAFPAFNYVPRKLRSPFVQYTSAFAASGEALRARTREDKTALQLQPNAQAADQVDLLAIDTQLVEQPPPPGSELLDLSVGYDAAAVPQDPTAGLPAGMMIKPVPVALLQLVEQWRAEFYGSKLYRASTIGEVQINQTAPGSLFFQLQTSETANAVVSQVGHSVLVPNRVTTYSPEDGGIFSVAHAQLMKFQDVLLQYQLPVAAVKPPVTAQLELVAKLEKDGLFANRKLLYFRLQYAAGTHLKGGYSGVMLDLQLPAKVSMPLKVAPAAQFYAAQKQLRWVLPDLRPGQSGSVMAAFSVDPSVHQSAAANGVSNSNHGGTNSSHGGTDAIVKAAQDLVCRLSMRNLSGVGSYSGVSLLQAPAGLNLKEHPHATRCSCELWLRP